MLEVVSQTYRNEYSDKLIEYQDLGALYYVIYSSRRRRKPHLEIYKLVNGKYELQQGNPVWLPEIGLGIGCERGNYGGLTREWLYWYDAEGKRHSTSEEQIKEKVQEALTAQQEAKLARQEAKLAKQATQLAQQQAQRAQQRAQEEAQRAEKLAQRLRELGINPDNL